jgi:hypothetical protein
MVVQFVMVALASHQPTHTHKSDSKNDDGSNYDAWAKVSPPRRMKSC